MVVAGKNALMTPAPWLPSWPVTVMVTVPPTMAGLGEISTEVISMFPLAIEDSATSVIAACLLARNIPPASGSPLYTLTV